MLPNLDDSGSSSLHTGDGAISNIAIQDVCPLDINEHLLIGTIDPVAYALAVDALTHAGPADETRISPATCLQVLQPGVNPVTWLTDMSSAFLVLAESLALAPHVSAEPPLRCYVTGGCPPGSGAGGAGAAGVQTGAGAQAPYVAKKKQKRCKKRPKKRGKRAAESRKKRGCKRAKKRRR